MMAMEGKPAFAGEGGLPELTGRVIDQSGFLSEQHRRELSAVLEAHAADLGSDVAVVLVGRLEGQNVQGYGERLVDHWNKGRSADGSVLLVIAPIQKDVFLSGDHGPGSRLDDVYIKLKIKRAVLWNLRMGSVRAAVRYGIEAILITYQPGFDWAIVLYLAGGLLALFGLSFCFTARGDLERAVRLQLREQRKRQKPVGSSLDMAWYSGGGGTSGAGILDTDQGTGA